MLSSLRKNINASCTSPSAPHGKASGLAASARSGTGWSRPSTALRSLAVLVAAVWSLPAAAEISDTVHPFVAVTVTHDDNLLRLADDVVGLGGPRSDTITQVQGGVLFARPIGRQILSGQAKLSKVTFGHYDQLNYDGKDLLAALEWHLGNHVQGHLGTSYAQSLTPFTDYHSTERNLRVQRRQYFDAAWRFHPSWSVHSGVSRDKFDYELAAQRYNERTEKSVDLGLDYLPSSDSRVGMVVRRLSGEYPNRRVFGSTAVDEGYDQNEVKANIYWYFSAVTQLRFLGGWVERKQSSPARRDTKGANGRMDITWAPLGKVRFTGSGWREFGSVESTLVNNSLNQGVSLGADWDVSAKVRANALIRRETRDFSTLSGIDLPDDTGDNTRSASIGLTYMPKPAIQLGVNFTHDVRSGSLTLGTGSYNANSVSFNASAQF